MEPRKSKSKVIKWAFIIGIIIVLNLFLNYSISLIFKSPQYEAYCPTKQINLQPTTMASCRAIGGQWNETLNPTDTKAVGYCDTTFTCNNNFQTASQKYELDAFITLISAGVILIILGLFLKVSEVVTIGFSLGGVLSLIIASGRYWSFANNILKVALLAVALIALIWIGVKKFQE